MTQEEELKARAQGESGMLAHFSTYASEIATRQAGEIAVLRARIAELTPKEEKPPKKVK